MNRKIVVVFLHLQLRNPISFIFRRFFYGSLYMVSNYGIFPVTQLLDDDKQSVIRCSL